MDFFARLGRTKFGKNVMPVTASLLSMGYLGTQLGCHHILRNLLSAQSIHGKREEYTDELQQLVIEVYDDVKDLLNKPIIEAKFLEFKPAPIKWFSTSLMDPVSFGMLESKTGSLIGLPSYFNYRSEEDIPSSVFDLKKFRLFKSFTKLKNKKEEADMEGFEKENIIRLDDHIDLKKEYANSLLLSDNAKKFAIAKELFIVDSYKPLAFFVLFSCSSTLAILMSRGSVMKFKLAEAHLSRRLPLYMISGLFGFGYCKFFYRVITDYYNETTTNKVKELGKIYEEGYAEYLSKRNQRLQVLRSINKLDS